jgi:transcriptional regulator with XRE-family HTH domain
MSRRERDRWLRGVGQALRRARERRGISQERLGLDCGLDRTYVSGIERGIRNPTIWAIRRLCVGLGIRMSKVFDEAEAPLK